MLLTSHSGLRGGAGIGKLLGQHRIGDTSQMLIEHNERVAPVTCSHSNRTLESVSALIRENGRHVFPVVHVHVEDRRS